MQDEYRLLFYDARGSGRSEDRPPYTRAQWVDDVDELTRQAGIDRFALLGHSYGGIVAQEYVLRSQDRLTHLVLVDTASSTVENEESIRRALAAGLPGIEAGWLRKLFEGRVGSNQEMREMWEQIAAAIPKRVVEVFEQSGHFPMVEEPEKFTSVIRSFLAQGRHLDLSVVAGGVGRRRRSR